MFVEPVSLKLSEKMTKSRKIYIGVLILATGALILDKTVLHPSVSAPQTTQARIAVPVPPNTASTINNIKEPIPIPKSPDSNEPENLPNLNTFEPTPVTVQNVVSKLLGVISGDPSPTNLPNKNRDLFSASDDFISAIRLAPINLPEPNVVSQEKPQGPVLPLKLTGIVIGPYRSSAYINGEVFFLNQNIGPYTLLSVNPDSVVLTIKNERITLFLDK